MSRRTERSSLCGWRRRWPALAQSCAGESSWSRCKLIDSGDGGRRISCDGDLDARQSSLLLVGAAAGRARNGEELRSGPPAAEQAVAAAERQRGPLGGGHVPRRRGQRPRLLAAVVRSHATVGVHR